MKAPGTDICISSSPEETARRGRLLAEELQPGSVIALSGPLGSGKTVFARGLGAGLGVPAGRVTSPTFTLISEHEGRLPFFHVDLYRLQTPGELAELGLEEYFDRAGVVVVEWAEKASHLLTAGTICVSFERLDSRRRKITVRR